MTQFFPNPVGNGTRAYTGSLSINGLLQPQGYALQLIGNLRQSVSAGSLAITTTNTSTNPGDTAQYQLTAGTTTGIFLTANQNAPAQLGGGPFGAQTVLAAVGSNNALVFGTNGTSRGTISNVGFWSINPPDTTSTALLITGVANAFATLVKSPAINSQSFGLQVNAGTTVSDISFLVNNASGTNNSFVISGDGSFTLGGGVGSQFDLKGDALGNAYTNDSTANFYPLGFRESPINIQNVNYNFQLSDRGKTVNRSAAGSSIFYGILANSSVPFPVGTVINMFGVPGAGVVNIENGSGVTLTWLPSGLTGFRAGASTGWVATIIQQTPNNWYIWGTGLS